MDIFLERRKKLADLLPDGSVAVIHSANQKIRNGDTDYSFRQDSDFLYLTNFNEADAALVIEKKGSTIFHLLCAEKDEVREKWEGPRLGPKNVSQLGFESGFRIDDLILKTTEFLDGADHLFCQNKSQKKLFFALTKGFKGKKINFDLNQKNIKSVDPLIHELRLLKSKEEISIIQKACDISTSAHERAMKAVKPEMYEYQLEAEYLHEFMVNGAKECAYPSIVGGGENACILHYSKNTDLLKDGDLVLVDAGCEYKGYASDITRTFPVNGKFSSEQKLIYEIVLESQKQSIESISEKSNPLETHKKSLEVIVEGLLSLGLLKGSREEVIETQSYSKFYMHRVGHWLGLDVHDVGGYEKDGKVRSYENGMITTIEPGIYISKEENVPEKFKGIGIRIEDDVLVENNQPKVLSSAIKELDDIQQLMAS